MLERMHCEREKVVRMVSEDETPRDLVERCSARSWAPALLSSDLDFRRMENVEDPFIGKDERDRGECYGSVGSRIRTTRQRHLTSKKGIRFHID